MKYFKCKKNMFLHLYTYVSKRTESGNNDIELQNWICRVN